MGAARRRRAAARPPAQRPYRLQPGSELQQRFGAALAAGAGEEGAHCIHELWMRGEYPASIERRLQQLWARAAASIPEWLPMRYIEWLPAAYEVAARLSPRTRGRYNLYLILLDFRERRRGPFGVYVGMSAYAPAQRFDQHKAGIRAAGSVLKRGLEVLTGPTLHLQHVGRHEAAQLEAQLAAALADAGLLVEGGH
ncbi:MAG: hypothetical protein JO341_02360 [Gammaproteobacteria bacterium]|nr:hypothetical protein [Gammaproteobacteria bacterium]MBV9619842.1 hypothetical protein [Gammaproteobacteria bacterium]